MISIQVRSINFDEKGKVIVSMRILPDNIASGNEQFSTVHNHSSNVAFLLRASDK